MSEKQLTETESLQLIGRMIHEARGYYYESGIASLVYGSSIFICSVLSYLRDEEMILFSFQPFYLMIPIFFLQAWIQIREERNKLAKTVTNEAIGHVWMGFFISALAAWCGGWAGWNYGIITIVLFLLAIAAFINGNITKFRYQIIAAFCCWALAVFSFFLQQSASYLVLAVAAVLVWIVPGFILNTKFRKQHR